MKPVAGGTAEPRGCDAAHPAKTSAPGKQWFRLQSRSSGNDLISASLTGETRGGPPIRLGRFAAAEIWMVAGVVLTSASVLLVFFHVAPPRLGTRASLLTTMTPWPLVIAGVAFALLNALVEQVLFRGAVLHHLGTWSAGGRPR